MSVQLILYPQNYNGTYTYTSNPVLNQYVADENFNSGLSASTGTTNSQPSYYAVRNSLPISAWKAFRSTGGDFGVCVAPSISGSGLTLYSNTGTTSSTGIYQLISNLTAGQCYEVKITVTTGGGTGTGAGALYMNNTWINPWSTGTYPNLVFWQSIDLGTEFPIYAGTITNTFTASVFENVLMLDYRAADGNSIVISNISITECPASAPQTYTDLSDGQVICDLYEEEAIPLSLSIDDFKNVAEKTQSYSKDFHLPNTKRNNKIFSHIFEVTRSTDVFSFNPYIKTRVILKEDSYTLFEGFLQLIDINDKEGEISYNVNLYSEPVTLADTLKQKTFNEIDFDELEHQYTKTNIENSWAGNLALDSTLPSGSFAGSGSTTNVLKYPLCDWTSNKHIDASGVVQFTNLEDAFRPFVKVKYLIDKIMSDAAVEYTSTFFDTTHFGNLFMDFNWGADISITLIGLDHLSLRLSNGSYLSAGSWSALYPTDITFAGFGIGSWGTFNTSNNRFQEDTDGTINEVSYEILIENTSGSTQAIELRWLKTSGSTTTPIDYQTKTIAANSVYTYQGNFSRSLDNGDFLQAQCKPASGSVIREKQITLGNWTTWATNTRTSSGLSFGNKIKNLRGELNQWEFLKGIFTMFNLVTVKEDDILRIEPYTDIFVRPIHALNTGATAVKPVQHNWTDKVDISEINLKPLELVKKTKFTYEEDEDDYAVNEYKKATSGFLYGTKKFNASGFTLSQGEEEIIATPFAPTVIKPIFDSYDNDFVVPTIYSGNDDGTEFEGFENAPRIMYDIQTVNLSVGKFSAPLVSPQFNGKMEFRQFGHLSTLPTTSTTKDINFGECQMVNIQNLTTLNLYNEYWSPYYNELYHSDTRIMTLKVNLTPADIQNFRFYDTVVIKNREYRVNKIEYKPNTLAKVEFILIP